MNPYNEREVLALLQEEDTLRKGFERIVAQYRSEQLYCKSVGWCFRTMTPTTFFRIHLSKHGPILITFGQNLRYLPGSIALPWMSVLHLWINNGQTNTLAMDAPEANRDRQTRDDILLRRSDSTGLAEGIRQHSARKTAYGIQLKYYQEMKIWRDVRDTQYW